MPSIPYDRLLIALWETGIMTAVSGLISFVIGLPLGLVLIGTTPGGLWTNVPLNRVLGAIVNAFRSLPFIILLVALIPLTRALVGTSIGTAAAIVPLSIAAIPYYARVAEVSLREVDRGLIEAVRAMGGSTLTVVREVLVPEALPGLISGFTVTLVLLIGASAMAGAVGAGGLGDLAIRYGYQRFDTPVMIAVIVVLIGLVALIQALGDRLARALDHR
ncbi:methionine ABC transporter permease [Lichenihabitans psoromatis]|uniref:methionine ABC transporter permease n=1 Tax=Lichenihabitans psoromatis TaxID=2528642 RepID=UPI001035FE6D|nr:methionine ABC transporter permease [Lichenihabitans psoromatis]